MQTAVLIEAKCVCACGVHPSKRIKPIETIETHMSQQAVVDASPHATLELESSHQGSKTQDSDSKTAGVDLKTADGCLSQMRVR